jgi:hypothetical protein
VPCKTHERHKECIKEYSGRASKEDIGLDGRIFLKYVL